MEHVRQSIISRERDSRTHQSSTTSATSSSQQSSYSSNVNRASASSATSRYDDSRNQVRGDSQDGQRYYVEDAFGGRRYIDGLLSKITMLENSIFSQFLIAMHHLLLMNNPQHRNKQHQQANQHMKQSPKLLIRQENTTLE